MVWFIDEPLQVGAKINFDIDKLLEMAMKPKLLDELTIKLICLKAREVFSEEENVLKVRFNLPITDYRSTHQYL